MSKCTSHFSQILDAELVSEAWGTTYTIKGRVTKVNKLFGSDGVTAVGIASICYRPDTRRENIDNIVVLRRHNLTPVQFNAAAESEGKPITVIVEQSKNKDPFTEGSTILKIHNKTTGQTEEITGLRHTCFHRLLPAAYENA